MNYSNIIEFDTANGKGVRTSLFVSGCNLHCEGCFNPQAQNFSYGKKYTTQTENYLISILKLPYIQGLSILGGDPMCQTEKDIYMLSHLCSLVHEMRKNVWLWTGLTWEDIMQDSISKAKIVLLNNCDVIVDGSFVQSLKDPSLAFRGSSNQRIIDVKQSLEKRSIILYNN